MNKTPVYANLQSCLYDVNKVIYLFMNSCWPMVFFSQGRPSGGISKEKLQFAKDYKHMPSLEDICREIKPSVAIGTNICHRCPDVCRVMFSKRLCWICYIACQIIDSCSLKKLKKIHTFTQANKV